MKFKALLLMLILSPLAMATTLDFVVEGAHASEKHSAKVVSRHPLQTLQIL